MPRLFWPWLVALLFSVALLPAAAQEKIPAPPPGPAAQPPAANAVAATVNGQVVPETAIYRALRTVPPIKHAEARTEILNYLIDNVLIDQFVRAQNVVIDAKEVDARIADMQAQLKKQNLEFAKVLHDMLLTAAELREHIAAEMRWDKYVSARATDAVLKELFTRKIDTFNGSLVHARHILLTPPANDAKAVANAKAELLALRTQMETQVAQALAKLPPNADALAKQQERAKVLDQAFAALAKQKSACPSKEHGGDVGTFPRSGRMVEPFAAAAFALKPYELSNVVSTQFGQHLILCVEHKPGKEIKYEDAKESVKEVYAFRLRESLLPQLRAKAKIDMK